MAGPGAGESADDIDDIIDDEEIPGTNIDKVCQLIHELKEQDLKHHKKRIADQVFLT